MPVISKWKLNPVLSYIERLKTQNKGYRFSLEKFEGKFSPPDSLPRLLAGILSITGSYQNICWNLTECMKASQGVSMDTIIKVQPEEFS